jgi:hypothetical protein
MQTYTLRGYALDLEDRVTLFQYWYPAFQYWYPAASYSGYRECSP